MADQSARSNPWVVCRQPAPDAEIRLFCLPYAGASGSIFREWQAGLPDWIEVCPIELPGRWARRQETPFTRLTPLVEALIQGIAPLLDRPFAVFGHSLGGLLAFELARHLRRQGLPQPIHLFGSGRRAPQLVPPTIYGPIHHLPDHAFLTKLMKQYGGVPAAVLQDPELLELVLPATRADVETLETYEYQHEPPLDCPISVFYGEDDHTQPLEDLRRWEEQSAHSVKLVEFEGRHFFIDESRSDVLSEVAARLDEHRELVSTYGQTAFVANGEVRTNSVGVK